MWEPAAHHEQQQTMDLYFDETNEENVQQRMQNNRASSNGMNLQLWYQILGWSSMLRQLHVVRNQGS